jgi:DivIVA domain-containing protein
MPDDRRLTISSTGRLSADEIARRTFATSRRGFDPAEVRAFLETLARDIHAAAEREDELRRALADAEYRAANPVLDEATLTTSLGQETARVLRTAHESAAELVARADGDAGRMRAEAQQEAEQVEARAEQTATDRAAQSEAQAADLRRRTQEEVTAKLEAVRLEAEALTAQARAECRAMVQEAQELRARVLADLTKRRRVLHSQIEQLRAGRERLAEAIVETRSSVNRITEELFRAEDEARLAAETAGRQAAAQPDPTDGLGALADPGAVSAPEGLEGSDVTMVVDEVVVTTVESEGVRSQAVEELFARLRAERAGEDAAPSGEAGAGARVEPTTPPSGTDPTVGETGPPDGVEPRNAEPDEARPAGDISEAGPDVDAGGGAGDPRLVRRDQLLVPIAGDLSRKLKRALQDDQNDVLDRLRSKGTWSDDVLPSEEEHRQRYVKASTAALSEAAVVGATLAGTAHGAPDAADIASELAISIVVPLRRRLTEKGAAIDDGDEVALIEHVGSAYREWKGARVERLAGDQAVAAFSAATVAASEDGATLHWVVDDNGDECPDCDDNALAGATAAGEAYPTGHVHPPAHAGCRCLLAPDTA